MKQQVKRFLAIVDYRNEENSAVTMDSDDPFWEYICDTETELWKCRPTAVLSPITSWAMVTAIRFDELTHTTVSDTSCLSDSVDW